MRMRTALRYHGGKWKLAPWIIQHLPPHRVYTEVFGGGASVLLRKARSYAEVYNDLNEDLVSFFLVLRDPTLSSRLQEQLRLTPFARREFQRAYEPVEDPVERARRTVIRSFMGFGSAGVISTHATGFRANSNRSGTTPAHDWANYPAAMPLLVERLQGVVIECRDALDCLARHDGDQTLHYVDPPYVHETRSFKQRRTGLVYTHEMDDDAHRVMAQRLRELKGMVVVSGYRCPLYDEVYEGWTRIDRHSHADGARARVESLWMNAAATPQPTEACAMTSRPIVYKITLDTASIQTMLAERYAAPEFALFYEVANGTGANTRRYADAIAMGLFPSRGLDLHGFEIKVSKSDWRRELANPWKSEDIQSYMDYWWVVAPIGIVDRNELPRTWGLLECNDKEKVLKISVKAPPLKPKKLDRSFLAALLRRAGQVTDEVRSVAIAKAVDAYEVANKEGWEREIKRHTKDYEELRSAVDQFEKESGIRICDRWHGERIGPKVKALLLSHDTLPDLLDRVLATLDNARAMAVEAQAELKFLAPTPAVEEPEA